MSAEQLPIPDFYEPRNARDFRYAPDQARVLEAATRHAAEHGVRPSIDDRLRVHLLLIDAQKDFTFPEGSLYVGGRSGTGAMDDSDRTARFIYRNLDRITDVTCTLDSHYPIQIFFPTFWVDAEGRMPAAHREVTSEQVRRGEIRPDPALAWIMGGSYERLLAQAVYYCEELEREGRYRLYLWPLHCELGSEGHALAGVIHEARLFHSFARRAMGRIEIKGTNLLTENYSIFAPEVLDYFDGTPNAHRDRRFLETLVASDVVVVAGQAASHCVKSSIDDLLTEILARDRELVRKVYLLEDCMSSVTVPDGRGGFLADFTPQTEAALQRFRDAGMHVVRSTDPMESWPDLHRRMAACYEPGVKRAGYGVRV